MKNSVIDLLLYSNSALHETIQMGKEYERLSDEEYEMYMKLKASLPEEYLKQFDKFSDKNLEVMCEANETFFREGMKYGLRLAVECLID